MNTVNFKGNNYDTDKIARLYIEENLTLQETFEKLKDEIDLNIKEFKSLVNKTGLKKSDSNRRESQGIKNHRITQRILKIIESSEKKLNSFSSKTAYARYLHSENPEYSVRQFEKRIVIEDKKDFVRFFEVYPELKDYLYDKDSLDINSISISSHLIVDWICDLSHIYQRSFQEMNRVKKYCYYCSNQKVLKGFNDLKSQYPLIALDYSFSNDLKADEIYCKSSRIVEWVCHKCSLKWSQALCNRTSYSESECSNCTDRISKHESRVLEFVKTFYTGEILRNKMPLREGSSRFQIDILLPELKLGFEVQDFATHSKTSEDEVSRFKGVTGLKKGPNYHENKRRLAKEQLDVTLIDLWQDEIESGDFEEVILEAIREVKGA